MNKEKEIIPSKIIEKHIQLMKYYFLKDSLNESGSVQNSYQDMKDMLIGHFQEISNVDCKDNSQEQGLKKKFQECDNSLLEYLNDMEKLDNELSKKMVSCTKENKGGAEYKICKAKQNELRQEFSEFRVKIKNSLAKIEGPSIDLTKIKELQNTSKQKVNVIASLAGLSEQPSTNEDLCRKLSEQIYAFTKKRGNAIGMDKNSTKIGTLNTLAYSLKHSKDSSPSEIFKKWEESSLREPSNQGKSLQEIMETKRGFFSRGETSKDTATAKFLSELRQQITNATPKEHLTQDLKPPTSTNNPNNLC